LWRLFALLYQHRGDVVDNDRLHAEQPLVANVAKENVRRLRKALAGSRYEIVNHPTLGYELIVNARRRTRRYRYESNSSIAGEPEHLAKDGEARLSSSRALPTRTGAALERSGA
jgi:hypothetical protein